MAGKKAPAAAAFPSAKGHPPSIEQRLTSELRIDDRYQRGTSAQDSRTMIRRIAETWDWRLCAPLTVSRRVSPLGDPDYFFVIDGQHRLEAARMRGDIAYLPCIISTFATIAEEAACFVAINTQRRRVSPLDTFRAALAAGDERAVQVNRLLTETGLRIAPTTNPDAWKHGDFSAVGGVKQAIGRYGEEATTAALRGIATAWPNEPLRYAGRILQGLYPLMDQPPAGIDRARVVQILAARPQAEWFAAMLRRQAKHGELPETAMQYAIADSCRSVKAA